MVGKAPFGILTPGYGGFRLWSFCVAQVACHKPYVPSLTLNFRRKNLDHQTFLGATGVEKPRVEEAGFGLATVNTVSKGCSASCCSEWLQA